MNDNDSLVSLTDSDDNFTYPSWYDETWKYLDILGKNTGYVPFDWQRENIHKRTEKRIIAACGRRAGKSTAIVAEAWKELLKHPVTVAGTTHFPLVYLVAPNYELTMRVWEPFVKSFRPGTELSKFIKSHNKERRLVELHSGAKIQAKSADNEVSLQGDRVTAAIVDEAHDVSDSARNEFMPALTDAKGRLIAIGVPQSNNWFRSYWERGQSTLQEDSDYYSFSVASTANPNIDESVMEEARLEYPEIEYRQRFLAEWAEAEGKVFKNVDDCFNVELQPWQKGNHYLMGLDVAKHHDYTVAYVINIKDMSIVASDRFNGLSYTALGPRIASMYQEYKCQTIHLDATGVGEAVRDILVDEGCHITSFKFTNQSKAQLVSTLVAEVEHGRVHFPIDDEQLKRELKLFEGKVMAGGTIQYSAPPGYFDDCVMAAGLAVLLAKQRQPRKINTSKKYLTFSNTQKRRFLTGVS
tara:strand:+ start:2648 stop:4051 length:1404 start_codon:yes stop_codon:yes gene_type:complete